MEKYTTLYPPHLAGTAINLQDCTRLPREINLDEEFPRDIFRARAGRLRGDEWWGGRGRG